MNTRTINNKTKVIMFKVSEQEPDYMYTVLYLIKMEMACNEVNWRKSGSSASVYKMAPMYIRNPNVSVLEKFS